MNDLVIIQTTQGLAHYILECNPQVTNTFLKLKNSILLSKVVCIVNETDGFDYYLTSNSKLRVELIGMQSIVLTFQIKKQVFVAVPSIFFRI